MQVIGDKTVINSYSEYKMLYGKGCLDALTTTAIVKPAFPKQLTERMRPHRRVQISE